jgi:hypothetical protein
MTYTIIKKGREYMPKNLNVGTCQIKDKNGIFSMGYTANWNEYYLYSKPHYRHIHDALKDDKYGGYHAFHGYHYSGCFNHYYKVPIVSITKNEGYTIIQTKTTTITACRVI